MSGYFEYVQLLSPPVKRAAFSDRTAYLMAEMSRLAYFRFEGGTNLDEVLKLAADLVPDREKYAALEMLIKNTAVSNSAEEAEGILKQILAAKGFELIRTFHHVDTDVQAFLCQQVDQNIAVLAFRGTEKKLKDIKTDVKCRLIDIASSDDVVTLHSGYYEQYQTIEQELRASIEADALGGRQLFFTGHSLGGALAIVATRFLACESSGACYTFGSPPVGTQAFDEKIKTPIYRIINHVDIVPYLPSPYLILLLRMIGFLLDIILSPLGKVYGRLQESGWYKKLQLLLIDAGRYRQSGYSSYLVGSATNAKLRYNVMFYDRVLWWMLQFKHLVRGQSAILADHSIELYAKMLANWATRRLK